LDRTYVENCPEYGRILDRRMTDVRPEDKAYGKKSSQNIGQEDGKILNRRQNIGQEDCRMLDRRVANMARRTDIVQEEGRKLHRRTSEY
jgi:hypothetical protein